MRQNSFLFVLIFLMRVAEANAQVSETKVVGVYGLNGVMETAAGLNMKADNTFEYGFTYGAADKWGRGSWKVSGNQVTLNSLKAPADQEFKVQSSSKNKQPGIQLKFTSSQGQPLQYIKCKLGEETGETDAQGQVSFKKIQDGKLEVYHPIFSTRASQLALNTYHNNFSIQPTIDLTEVIFQNYVLEVAGETLVGTSLPGMPATDAGGQLKRYVFKRQ